MQRIHSVGVSGSSTYYQTDVACFYLWKFRLRLYPDFTLRFRINATFKHPNTRRLAVSLVLVPRRFFKAHGTVRVFAPADGSILVSRWLPGAVDMSERTLTPAQSRPAAKLEFNQSGFILNRAVDNIYVGRVPVFVVQIWYNVNFDRDITEKYRFCISILNKQNKYY